MFSTLVITTVVAVVLHYFARRRFEAMADYATAHTGRVIGIGALVYPASIVFIAACAITIIGVPAAIAAGALLAGMTYVGHAIAALALSRALRGTFVDRDDAVRLVVASILLGLVIEVPIGGWILGIGTAFWGVGTLVDSRLGTRVNPVGVVATPSFEPVAA